MRRFDVAVIGAGPAGCILARRLAELGHSVALIERAVFPRPHIGVSLSPGVAPLLAHLGLDEILRTVPHRRFCGRFIDWADGGRMFRPEPAVAPSVTIDRGAFDMALTEAATARGAILFQPARLRAVSAQSPGWGLDIDTPAGPHRLSADILADATGRIGVLPRRRRRIGPPLLALHAGFRGDAPDALPEITAAADGWCWTTPLASGTHLAVAFTNPGDPGKRPVAERFAALLGACALAGNVSYGPVAALDAGAWLDQNCIGTDFIKVGDCALATDPVSASGVQRSMQGALTGAVVLNTMLRRADQAGQAASFYRQRQETIADAHGVSIQTAYGEPGRFAALPFWQKRGRTAVMPLPFPRPCLPPPEIRLRRSKTAVLTLLPGIIGDFVELHPALSHPNLPEPVAFVANQPIVPLLESLPPALSCAEIAAHLARDIGPRPGAEILQWLVRQGILEAVPVDE
jgi:flavin-dependent dehydrogenase